MLEIKPCDTAIESQDTYEPLTKKHIVLMHA